jgi:hypothetical protein
MVGPISPPCLKHRLTVKRSAQKATFPEEVVSPGTIDFAGNLSEERAWMEDGARETIGLAKPAHTYYGLNLRFSGGHERR